MESCDNRKTTDAVTSGAGQAPSPLRHGADQASERRDIGWAVKQMWNGDRVTREGWNGKGMWLAIQRPDAHSKMSRPYVYMCTADDQLVPWICSQSDLLAFDFRVSR